MLQLTYLINILNVEHTVLVILVIFLIAHAFYILGNFVACDQMNHICDTLC